MGKAKRVRSWEDFARVVKPLSIAQVSKLGLKEGFEQNDVAMFDVRKLEELKRVVEKHGGLHIITSTSDFDSVTGGLESWSNEVRKVNRLNYALAEGSKAPLDYMDTEDLDVKVMKLHCDKLGLGDKTTSISLKDVKALTESLMGAGEEELADYLDRSGAIEDPSILEDLIVNVIYEEAG